MQVISGTVKSATFQSRALCKPMRLSLYLPPGYRDSDRACPVLYLLHDWGWTEGSWFDLLDFSAAADRLISAGAVPPFIAAMPQGDKSFFIDAADPDGSYETLIRFDPAHYEGALEGCGFYGEYLLEDVLPFVERKFRVLARPSMRALGGIGMGATGAAALALSKPGVFSKVGMHSPLLYDRPGMGPPWIFGLSDEAAFRARDPRHLAETAPLSDFPAMYLDTGIDDDSADLTGSLHNILTRRGVKHTYRAHSGGHDLAIWQDHLAEYLGFYTAGWAAR
jgi:enterochelin esterase-like enzyme